MKPAGRVALVTGGGRGIGRAVAAALLDAGAAVCIGDLDAGAGRGAAAGLAARGRVLFTPLDVAAPGSLRDALAATQAALGPVDILVNNAGYMPVAPFAEQSLEQIHRLLAVNVQGVIDGTRLALPGMLARGRGAVINIASLAGRVPTPGASVYAASKFAVLGFSESLRMELRGTGVQVSAVLPWFVRTGLIEGLSVPGWLPAASPEDVAAATLRALLSGAPVCHVPRLGSALGALPSLLPHRLAERVARGLGLFRVFEPGGVDHQARRRYRSRVGWGADG